ncbi:MAG: hypothetical protein GY759_10925 [Chloroflexi bacterium]|nr:hypothetical protein [Chloroflexota bacterium]
MKPIVLNMLHLVHKRIAFTPRSGVKRFHWIVLAIALPLIVGCGGTLQAGIESTPPAAPSPAEISHAATVETLSSESKHLLATVETLQNENARLNAALAATVVAIPEPNAGRLAYIQGGDIWVKELFEGSPERMTTDGRNQEPKWSPSGTWLAFRKTRSVVVEIEDCSLVSQRRLCRAPVVQQQLWLVNTETNGARSLNGGLTVQAFAWSPLQDRLAFSNTRGQLLSISGDSASARLLTPSAGLGIGHIDNVH